jgi:hypothetical protein
VINDSSVSSPTFTKENFQKLLVKFLLRSNLPYNFVNDNQSFQELLNFCNDSTSHQEKKIVQLPSRNTIKKIILDHFRMKKEEVKSLLNKQSSLCFTMDGWKSPNRDDYIGITANYIDKDTWLPKQVTIGFEYVSEHEHTGN